MNHQTLYSSSSSDPIISVSTVASTRWLALKTLQYHDPCGKVRSWDLVSRTTKKQQQDTADGRAMMSTDAVIILPVLRNTDGSIDTILVEQFRPPVQCSTLEFPAGLVDSNESIEQAALRELYEETGFVGESSSCQSIPYSTSRPLCMSPGLADEIVQVVIVDVDCSRGENQTPKQHLDEGEYVTFRRVPLTSGLRSLMEQDSEHSMPIMGLYMFALGLELGFKLNQSCK